MGPPLDDVQAVIWEAHRQHDEVALYLRTLIRASQPGGRAALLNAVRQQADALGLAQAGLRGHRWVMPRPGADTGTEAHPARRDRSGTGPRLEDGGLEVG